MMQTKVSAVWVRAKTAGIGPSQRLCLKTALNNRQWMCQKSQKYHWFYNTFVFKTKNKSSEWFVMNTDGVESACLGNIRLHLLKVKK